MTARQVIMTTAVFLTMTGGAYAQTERVQGEAKVETVKMTGEVAWVQGDWLFAKMQPLGNYSLFNVKPGREFVIDGQTKHISDLKPGTILTGTITTRTTPVTLRTTNTLSGTVWHVQGNFVVLTLPTGENKEYRVPDSFKFNVEGKPASVTELRAGMKVTATKITEEPQTEISTDTQITGTAPK